MIQPAVIHHPIKLPVKALAKILSENVNFWSCNEYFPLPYSNNLILY